MFFKKKDKNAVQATSTVDINKQAKKAQKEQAKQAKKEKKQQDKENQKKRFFKKRYIPLLLLLLIAIGISVVRFTVLTNDKVENIITGILLNSIGREVDISSFDYRITFTGIEIKDIVIYNSEKFDNKVNATIGRIYIRLSLSSLLALNVNIIDISFEDINVYLFTNEQGEWNVPDLKASVKEPEPEEDKEPFDLAKLDMLKLKIDVDNIAIKNFNVFIDSTEHDTENGMKAALQNFNFSLALHSKRFAISELLDELSYLPDLYILTYFEDFKLVTSIDENSSTTVAAADESGNLNFNNSMLDIASTFLLNLNIEYPREDMLALNISADFPELEAKYEGKPLDDLGFSFNLDNEIDVETMSVWIDDLSLHLFNNRVFGFKGHFLDLIYPDDIDIMLENERGSIDLTKVNNLANIIMPDLGMNIKGDIIIDEITAKGSDKDLDNDIKVILHDIDLAMKGGIALQNLNITNTIKFNYKPESFFDDGISLQTYLTLDRAIVSGLPHVIGTTVDLDVVAPLSGIMSIGDALGDPSIKPNINIGVNRISTRFNQATIDGSGNIRINEPFNLLLNIKGFSLREMTDNFLRGSADARIDLSGSLISALDVKTQATVNNFSYNMGGDVSRQTSLKLNLNAFANLISQDVNVRTLDFSLSTFFNMNTTAQLKGLGLKSGVVDIKNIRIAPYSIKNWLSPNFASLLGSLNFGDDIFLKNRLTYTLNLPAQRATVANRANINISDDKYPLDDLVLIFNGDVNFSKNMYANIRQFELSSQTNNFYVKANGYAAADLNKMDLSYEVKFDNPHMIIPSSINIGGLLAISGNLKDSYAKGKFESKNFYFGMGTRGNESMLLEGLNGGFNYNFDIVANRGSAGSGSSTSVNRYTALTSERPNLFFDLFKLNLNIAGLIDDAIRVTDFKAVFDINSHAVAIKEATASLYIGGERKDADFYASVKNGTAPKEGAISIPWLLFDMGNFSPNTFKYDMRILASDINLKYLLPAENRDNVDEEKVLVNFTGDISGVGVSPLRSINVNTFFLGINKMSLEFSKFLVEMIKPMNPSIETVENIIRFGYDPSVIEFNVANNKLFTTFYFRDQNLDKTRQQKAQLLGFKDDRLRLEPILFSDVISFIESTIE